MYADPSPHNLMPLGWCLRWLVMTALLTFVGMAFAVSTYVSSLAGQRPITWLSALISQLLHFGVWAALCPAFIWLDQTVRAEQWKWSTTIAVHLIAGVMFAGVQLMIFGGMFWALLDWTVFRYDSLGALYQAIFLPRLVLGVVIYKIIVTTNYALDYYAKYRAERERAARLEAHLAQAQLQALRMQLQPHFLFNTLNSISSLILAEPRTAVQMVARLGDFLRLTIETNGTHAVTLARELEFLKCYLEIQQMRFRERLQVRLKVTSEALRAQVPNLILQPIVENAIKHGIAPRAANGWIEISAARSNGHLQIQVRNDGPPLQASQRGEGLGLTNTRERLQQVYRDQFRFDLTRLAEGGAVVTLEIPFAVAEVVDE